MENIPKDSFQSPYFRMSLETIERQFFFNIAIASCARILRLRKEATVLCTACLLISYNYRIPDFHELLHLYE